MRPESFRFKARGSSMSPFIKDNDIVTISLVPGSSARLGEPAAFIHPRSKRFIIHRVVKKTREYYLAKGDNISDADGLVARESVLGTVIRIERNGRDVCFGNGPERALIAFLSRGGSLSFLFRCWRSIPFSVRKFIKWKVSL